ncbi:MAG: DUF3501 family protein, partial [Candidatus Thiodiazotropha taylori]
AVEGHEKIRPIANEDLERTTEDKTSAVHFIRFELTDGMIESLKNGAKLSAGIDHAEYNYTIDGLDSAVKSSLISDLN